MRYRQAERGGLHLEAGTRGFDPERQWRRDGLGQVWNDIRYLTDRAKPDFDINPMSFRPGSFSCFNVIRFSRIRGGLSR